MLNKRTFEVGIKIDPKTTLESDQRGEIEVSDVDGKLNYNDGSGVSPVVTEVSTATLTNKTIDADANTIVDLETDNLKSGVLSTDLTVAPSNTQIPSALAVTNYVASEVGGDVDDLVALTGVPAGSTNLGTFTGTTIPDNVTIKAGLQALETSTETKLASALPDTQIFVGSGAGQATPVAVSGDVTITNTGVVQIAPGVITNADVNASAGIEATKIANGSVSNAEFQFLDGVTSGIQGQLDTKVAGPASAVDNRITRFDGTTGKLVQSSNVTLDDSGSITGIDNLNVGGNTQLTGPFQATNTISYDTADDTASGANATLATVGTRVIRLTNVALASVDAIPAGGVTTEIIVENVTGTTITINNETGATAANRILTGTGSNITLFNNASLLLSYDTISSRWRVISNLGSSGAGTDLSIVTVTTTYSIGNNDNLVLANATSAAFTVTLPTAVGITGRQIRVFKTDGTVNRVTIATTSSQTINGSTTQILGTQFDVVTMVSDGANWVITSNEVAVAARYSTNAGQAVASAIVNFEDLTYDSHNAVTTGASWKFTAPSNGKYKFSANIQTPVTPSVGDTLSLSIYKNNVETATGPRDTAQSTTTRRMTGAVYGTIALNKNDFIDFRMNDGITPAGNLEADNTICYVQIDRVGN